MPPEPLKSSVYIYRPISFLGFSWCNSDVWTLPYASSPILSIKSDIFDPPILYCNVERKHKLRNKDESLFFLISKAYNLYDYNFLIEWENKQRKGVYFTQTCIKTLFFFKETCMMCSLSLLSLDTNEKDFLFQYLLHPTCILEHALHFKILFFTLSCTYE